MSIPLLQQAPRSVVNEDGGFAFGSYRGMFRSVDYSQVSALPTRVAREKRWLWYCLVKDPWIIAFAVVRTGYASSCFAFVQNLAEKRFAAHATHMGSTLSASVSRAGFLTEARFGLGRRSAIHVESMHEAWGVNVNLSALRIEAECLHEPPPLSAIVRVPGGTVNATEKGIGLCRRGRLWLPSTGEIDLEGASCGYDFTHGLLGRRTAWRWAFGLGRDAMNRPVGVNVVSGFVGAAECVVLGPSGPIPISEPSFQFDATRYDKPWRIHGDTLDLRAEIKGIHEDRKRLLVLRTDFVQAAAILTGNMPGMSGARLLGVVEDQDVLW